MSKKVGLFLCPKGGGLRKWHPECDSCQDRWSWRKAQEHRIFCGECRQEVPAGNCRCFFQCEHQCFNDGRDVQVLCAYRQCAGVLGRGFVRSYLPCSSSWINWTAWIEFQKGEVAHDITLALIGSARNGNQDLVLSLSTKAKKMLRNMRTRSLFWAKECRTILRKLMEEKRTLSLMAWMHDEKDVFDVCSWHARNHVVYI